MWTSIKAEVWPFLRSSALTCELTQCNTLPRSRRLMIPRSACATFKESAKNKQTKNRKRLDEYGLFGRVASRKSLLQTVTAWRRLMKVYLNKTSDPAKVEMFSHNAQQHVWKKPSTASAETPIGCQTWWCVHRVDHDHLCVPNYANVRPSVWLLKLYWNWVLCYRELKSSSEPWTMS